MFGARLSMAAVVAPWSLGSRLLSACCPALFTVLVLKLCFVLEFPGECLKIPRPRSYLIPIKLEYLGVGNRH